MDHLLDGFAREVRAHAVVDAPPGEDNLGVVAGELCLVREVIRVHADAVPADEARPERQEVPLRAGGLQHLVSLDPQPLEDDRKLVDERDIEVALRVLDHLGRFGDFDRRRAVYARLHHRTVQLSDLLQRLVVVRRHDLANL